MKERQIIRMMGQREIELLELKKMLARKRQPKLKLSNEERKSNIIERIAESRERARNKSIELKRRLDLEKELNLSYRHFRLPYEITGPILSIGWRVIRILKENFISYSVAICSKNDYFDRKEARNHINDRFNSGHYVTFSMNNSDTIELKSFDELILGHFRAHKFDTTVFNMDIPLNAKFI